MPGFSEEWLRELLMKNEIVDVVGSYLPLVKKGASYWATCPWHPDSNPSFCVTPAKEMFYCFSCKRGGSVVNFIMEQEKLNYREAVEFLAQRVGMEVPQGQDRGDYKKRKEQEQRLFALMKEAARFYHDCLKRPEGQQALAYLKDRGAASQIVPFGLGYAPDSFDATTKYLTGKGYALKDILDAGLAKKGERGVYDTFRGRVMFPIINVVGNVIGFGGRVLGKGEPKYLNSPETVIFNKRRNLYALNAVKKRRDLKSILLVEGYMDVIGLASFGVCAAVASLGTSLTKEQARLLKRYTDKVYLSYDGDVPGLNAALKATDILTAEGLQVFVMVLPEGKDPDEYVRQEGAKAFYAQAKKAMPAVMFKLSRIRESYNLRDPDETVQYCTKAVEILKSLENELEKERYVKFLARETGISETSITAQMGMRPKERYIIPKNETKWSKEKTSSEDQLLSMLIENPELSDRLAELEAEDFVDPAGRQIFLFIQAQRKKGISVSSAEIISKFAGQADIGKGLMENLARAGGEETIGHSEEFAHGLAVQMRIKRLNRQKADMLRELDGLDAHERANKLRTIQHIGSEIAKLTGKKVKR